MEEETSPEINNSISNDNNNNNNNNIIQQKNINDLSEEEKLKLALLKERMIRMKLQNRVQAQQYELYKQTHPKQAYTTANISNKPNKKEKKFTFTIAVSQVSPQKDGNIHITAGYKIYGYIILKVKQPEYPFLMSALSLSLKRIENVMLSDAEGARRKKVLQSIQFPISKQFEHAMNQPTPKGCFSWKCGVYRFPFIIETNIEYLPTFDYQQKEPYMENAFRFYDLEIHYRKSVSDNEPWQLCHKTPIYIHQYRKLLLIMEYAKKQQLFTEKISKFILCRGNIKSSIGLIEEKTVYFMCYHSLPIRLEIDNQASFNIKNIIIRLCQDINYRTSTKGNSMLLRRFILWEKDISLYFKTPIQKNELRTIEKLIIPLDSPSIRPTSVKKQKTLFYLTHFIEMIIKTPKKVSDISIKQHITIVEPPIEHLAQAIYKRSLVARANKQKDKEVLESKNDSNELKKE